MHIDRDRLRRSWQSTWTLEADEPQGELLRLVWPAVFALVLGVAIGLWGSWEFDLPARAVGRMIANNVFISLVVAYCVFALTRATRWAIGGSRLQRMAVRRRQLLTMAVVVTGVASGWPLAVSLLGVDLLQLSRTQPQALRFIVGLTLLTVLFMAVWFAGEARRHEVERQATEARLRLLQGQIEPHFLFNTLANVLSLMDNDPPRAKKLLETFIDYLRASLGPMRREHHTLGQELELVDAYLQLLQMRMGERLHYRIDAAPSLRSHPVAPLLLQPLVENAIHHGLEPKIEGGQVVVTVQRDGQHLVVEVRDDGLGLDATPPIHRHPGTGTALSNIRERLAARYGPAASLTLQPASPGTLARLELPLETAE